MALKDKWVDKVNGVDIASADDINQVAGAVIELENNAGSGGANGKDGFSPIVSIEKIDGGNRVVITDAEGEKPFDVMDGADGKDGKNGVDGNDGSDGEDGVSATHSWNGTVLTITSASGTTSADLKGEKGDKGDKGDTGATGAAGANGKDGTSVTVKSVSESTESGGSNVVTFTDGKTLTVKNGKDGTGTDGLPSHRNTPHKPQTIIVNDCQDSATYKGSGLTVNTTDNIMGDQCVNVSGKSAYIRFTKNTFNVKNNHLVIKVRVNNLDPNVQLYVKMAHTTSTANYSFHVVTRYINETNTPFGEWREYTIPYESYRRASSANVSALDFTKINDIFVGVMDNSGGSGTGNFDIQFIGLRPNTQSKGIVSFTFDDGWKTQYDGIRILSEKGLTGTIFHIINPDDASADRLTTAELKELVDYYGADIEVHNGIEYQNMTNEELAAHWREYQAYLQDNGLSDGRHMAYPGGSHPTRVVDLARKYFDSCRTIQGFMKSETYPPYDNYRIRALSAITDANKATAKDAIDAAVANKTWAILVFHKIDTTSNNDGMYCSPEVLAELADYAIASGARIMNYAEVFETNGGGSGVDIQDIISALPVYNGEVVV